jgi:hypothetical protein
LSNILEFFHGIAAQARGAAGGEQSTHEVRLSRLQGIPLSNALHSRVLRLNLKPHL